MQWNIVMHNPTGMVKERKVVPSRAQPCSPTVWASSGTASTG